MSAPETTTPTAKTPAVGATPGLASVRSGRAKIMSLQLRITCGTILLGIVAWACWPLGGAAGPGLLSSVKPSKPDLSAKPPQKKPLDLAAFRAPLWVVPAPPPAPPGPPPPPPPLKLQLIAIISPEAQNPARAALLYDPDQDKLLTVHEGEALQGRRIDKITDMRVHIRDGAGERVLALRTDGPGGQP